MLDSYSVYSKLTTIKCHLIMRFFLIMRKKNRLKTNVFELRENSKSAALVVSLTQRLYFEMVKVSQSD